MKVIDNEINLQKSNLINALQRNINHNFSSVSFDFTKDGIIQIKVILNNKTDIELDLINDISAEFTAVQNKDNVDDFLIVIEEEDSFPLKFLIYKSNSSLK